MFKLILILLLICSGASAQSGVALDAWVRSKDTAENTYSKAEVDADFVATSAYAIDQSLKMDTDGSNAIATDTRTNISVYSKAEIDAAFAALDVTAILTESGTLAAGETSITTTGDKFAIGTLYLAGAMYDLSDSTQITVDNSGANTVLIIPEALEFDAGWTLTKMTDYSPIIEDILDNILGS